MCYNLYTFTYARLKLKEFSVYPSSEKGKEIISFQITVDKTVVYHCNQLYKSWTACYNYVSWGNNNSITRKQRDGGLYINVRWLE